MLAAAGWTLGPRFTWYKALWRAPIAALFQTWFAGQLALQAVKAEPWRSTQSARERENGAQGRNRTTDTVIFSHVLYQLSYLGSGRERL